MSVRSLALPRRVSENKSQLFNNAQADQSGSVVSRPSDGDRLWGRIGRDQQFTSASPSPGYADYLTHDSELRHGHSGKKQDDDWDT
jgi:hypothetical protein